MVVREGQGRWKGRGRDILFTFTFLLLFSLDEIGISTLFYTKTYVACSQNFCHM